MTRPIQEILSELTAALTPPPSPPQRNVSIMAKNIRHGDVADLPHHGPTRIDTWSRCDGWVLLGGVSVPEDQRLRVLRDRRSV